MRVWVVSLFLFLSLAQISAFASGDGCLDKSLLFPTYEQPLKKKIIYSLINNLSGLRTLDEYYKQAMARMADNPDKSPWRLLLEALEVGFKTNKPIEGAIPKDGPLVVFANHPFGGLDGIALLDFITRNRKDVKIMISNSIVERMEELRPVSIPIELRKTTNEAKNANRSSMDGAIEHVQNGGAMIIFPAGSMAKSENILKSFFESMVESKTVDKPWRGGLARLATMDDVTLLPVFFHGGNSTLFHTMGVLPKIGDLRNAMLISEIVNKRGLDLNVSIGEAISPTQVRNLVETHGRDQLTGELRKIMDELSNSKH